MKDTCQEARPQSFIRMNGNNLRSSVRLLQEVVTTFDPGFFKTNSAKDCDESLS